ncbi:MAG: tRNA (guanine-N1)-methyltransferase [Flavicella sp.]|nr:tRNA (guanine-N1)-methyltransferase [Flavicella sp.]
MKNGRLLIYIFLLIAIPTSNAQKKKLENPFETKGDLNSQFIYLEKTSTNYKEYKVITKVKFNKLHKNVLDSLANQKKLLNSKHEENNNQLTEINRLKKELADTKEALTMANTNKDSISVMGISMYKNNYNLIAGIIIITLLIVALFFFYKFNNSNIVTKEAKLILKETQDEYEAHQKKSLVRQQELSRKLQDEIIKNRKD